MSAQSIENMVQAPPQAQKQDDVNVNEGLLEEVPNLKKIVPVMVEKESERQHQDVMPEPIVQQIQQNNPQSQFLQSKFRRIASKEQKAGSRQDIYKNVRNDWKVRIHSRQKVASELKDDEKHKQTHKKPNESKLKLVSQDQNERANLDESIINKHLSFLNSRSDTDEQQPAKTQFNMPQTKQGSNASSNEFRFKKINLIPAIQNQHNRFRSYISSQRKNVMNNTPNQSRQSTSLALNRYKFSGSQPDLPKRKPERYTQGRQAKMIYELKRIQIKRQTQRQELIENGKKLLKMFYNFFNEETTFNIKRYKNCIVFSLLPAVTKALIYHYCGDVYFGNVSLDENGHIEKNGIGIQIRKQRHFYQGHFVNGKKNGRGKIQYENGDVYDGQWNEGEIYGFGKYHEHKSDRSYQGFWKRGEYCGQKTSKQPTAVQFF